MSGERSSCSLKMLCNNEICQSCGLPYSQPLTIARLIIIEAVNLIAVDGDTDRATFVSAGRRVATSLWCNVPRHDPSAETHRLSGDGNASMSMEAMKVGCVSLLAKYHKPTG